jgi:Domain of unknown function (DUF397)
MTAQQGQSSRLTWRRSRASGGNGECVEVACGGQSVLGRDSRDRSGSVLAFAAIQWSEFVRRVRNEERPSLSHLAAPR